MSAPVDDVQLRLTLSGDAYLLSWYFDKPDGPYEGVCFRVDSLTDPDLGTMLGATIDAGRSTLRRVNERIVAERKRKAST